MRSPVCELFDIEFPLFAFSHCRDVVAAVSRAGGMGVFGAVACSPEELESELSWIDKHVDGKPYGLDLIVPNKVEGKGQNISTEKMLGMIPEQLTSFAEDVLQEYDVDAKQLDESRRDMIDGTRRLQGANAEEVLQAAFKFPIKLVVNALGFPPPVMLEMARQHNIPVGALIGTKQHALSQVENGVDILIAAGGEAGGHTGEVSTMVLLPEVCQALAKAGHNTPVLAAGGIASGAQMAAAMAMGAAGAWCGSVWLTTAEAETNPVVKTKMLAASSRDTVRSRSRTGKPSRQLRSSWTDAWEQEDAPSPLPMPLQSLVSEPALRKIDKLSQGGHDGAKELATYWVGQAVGLMNESMSAGQVVQTFKEDFLGAYERLTDLLSE